MIPRDDKRGEVTFYSSVGIKMYIRGAKHFAAYIDEINGKYAVSFYRVVNEHWEFMANSFFEEPFMETVELCKGQMLNWAKAEGATVDHE